MWMNLSRQPERGRAQPFWCIRHDMSARDDVLGARLVVIVRPCRSPSWPTPAPRRRRRCRRSRSIRRAGSASRARSPRTLPSSRVGLEKNGSSISEALALRSRARWCSDVQADLVRELGPGNSRTTLRTSCRNSTSSRVLRSHLLHLWRLLDRVRWSRTWWAQLPDGVTMCSNSLKLRDEQRLGAGAHRPGSRCWPSAGRSRSGRAGSRPRRRAARAARAWRCRPPGRRRRRSRE